MGVLNLWQILGPVKQHQELSELKGQVLAVDLSIWVCETQCVKQMQGVVSKPFLRNLFFRILHLLQLGVHLVFVVEGEAPDLKKDVMQKRQQDRFRSKGFRGQTYKGPRGGGGKGGRRNFNACLRECCRMLDCLGIPYLHSNGEAEAFCAALNAAGLVDGCLTNDGDAFLYGARTIYRNFTMNTKDPHVESYSMNDIESCLGLDREKMVAMALLLGCDYLPKGVPGVGVDKAIKLMTTLQDYSILDRFQKWRRMSDSDCVNQIESLVRKKALVVRDFPQVPVINEFLTSRDKCPSAIKSWKRPQIADFQKFALDKMEWVVEYTLEKVLPLVTLWDMTFICKHGQSSERSDLLQPVRILKSRTRQGVQCYEVEWHKPETDTISPQTVYTTIETQDLFSKCYPQFVHLYDELMAAKKTKGKSRKKKDAEEETDVVKRSQELEDDLSQAVQNLSLTTEPRGSQVKGERIQEEKLSTNEWKDTEEETRYRTTDNISLNNLENNMVSLSSMLPHHVGNSTAKTSVQFQAPLVKLEHINSTGSEHKGKVKVIPKVKVNGYKKSSIKLSDFTSGLLLDVSRDVQECHRKDKATDFYEESLEKSGKQNGRPDRKMGSEVSSQVKICKEDVSRTDEESSEDEEEDYIPLSQRVQINLKKAINKKDNSIRSADLDMSRLCTMLDSVQNLPGSQQLSSKPDTHTDTLHQPHLDTQTDIPRQSHLNNQMNRMCEELEAHLPYRRPTGHGVRTEKTKENWIVSGQSCTLDTTQNSDKTSPNIEKVKQELNKLSVPRMTVKSVHRLKSNKAIRNVKGKRSCGENQVLQLSETSTKGKNDKPGQNDRCVVDSSTSSLTKDCVDQEESDYHITKVRQEICSVSSRDTTVPTAHIRPDSCLESVKEEITCSNPDIINVDTIVMTSSSSGVTQERLPNTDQINILDSSQSQYVNLSNNVPDVSLLSPCVNLSHNQNTIQNCSQDLFNSAEFSCVEGINFTISTPNLTSSNRGMTCRETSQHVDHCDTTPTGKSTPLYHRHDICRPVLVQETPFRTERCVNFHQSVLDQKSFTASPHNMFDYEDSINMTCGKSVLDFGNFQIESSLLRSMDRGHQTSINQSQDFSGLGDLSGNNSQFVSLEKDGTQNQHMVSENQLPVSFLRKTLVQSDTSIVVSTSRKSSIIDCPDYQYIRTRNQKECQAVAEGSEGISNNTLIKGSNTGSSSSPHKDKGLSSTLRDCHGNHILSYTGTDGSLGFSCIDDGTGDHCPSPSENMEGDEVNLCGSVSPSYDKRMPGMSDVHGQYRKMYPDATAELHTSDPKCYKTSEHLVSGCTGESSSGDQRRKGRVKGHTHRRDKRLEVRENMTSSVEQHMKKLDRRLDCKENINSDSVSVPHPGNDNMDTLDKSLENTTSHSAPGVALPTTKYPTDSSLISKFGEDSYSPKLSCNLGYKTVSGRTSPDLQNCVTPAAKQTTSTNVTVEVDHSPVALADRLRARLRKASDRSILGDITDSRHHLGTMGAGKQEYITIVID